MNVELLAALLPASGQWVDLGSFGHDALRLQQIRPDVSPRLFAYPGTGSVIVCDDAGLHHASRGHVGGITIEDANFEQDTLPLRDSSIDLISCFEVIEHFKFGPQRLMHECNRVLKDGGLLIASTPNIVSADAIARILALENPAVSRQYHRDFTMGRIHPLEYDYGQINSIFNSFGFKTDYLVSVSLNAPDASFAAAVRAAEFFRIAMGRPQRHVHLGAHWYAIARKVSRVTDAEYPSALFE